MTYNTKQYFEFILSFFENPTTDRIPVSIWHSKKTRLIFFYKGDPPTDLDPPSVHLA